MHDHIINHPYWCHDEAVVEINTSIMMAATPAAFVGFDTDACRGFADLRDKVLCALLDILFGLLVVPDDQLFFEFICWK